MSRPRSRFAIFASLFLGVAPLCAAFVANAQTPPVSNNVRSSSTTPSSAATSSSLPAWEQLDQSQRETLVAPMRDRWNDNPGERTRLYDHAKRWKTMTHEQRKNAQRGMKRWSNMSPEKREAMHSAFEKMRNMTPEQRREAREKLKAMTPEQREAWFKSRKSKPPAPSAPRPATMPHVVSPAAPATPVAPTQSPD